MGAGSLGRSRVGAPGEHPYCRVLGVSVFQATAPSGGSSVHFTCGRTQGGGPSLPLNPIGGDTEILLSLRDTQKREGLVCLG